MNVDATSHSILTLLTIQIAKTQLILRELRRGQEIDPERLRARLEEIERLAWRMAEAVATGDPLP